jgi:branched-chain amino acid transport system permease protein
VLFQGFRSAAKSWVGLVASIGLYVLLQNVVSIGFGDETLVLRADPITVGRQVGNAFVTSTQGLIVLASVVLFAGTAALLATTKLGRAIRGVASNPDLCVLLGIEPRRIARWAIGIGSALAALAGTLSGFDSDLTPTMGFRLLMNGVVVMIIGGIGGIGGFPLAALLLALAQHLAAYYLDAKWMDAAAFLILITFLIWKPLGFRGRRLRKVEV